MAMEELTVKSHMASDWGPVGSRWDAAGSSLYSSGCCALEGPSPSPQQEGIPGKTTGSCVDAAESEGVMTWRFV